MSSFPRSSPKVAGVPGWTPGAQDGPVSGAAGGEGLVREPSGPALVEAVSWEGLQPVAGGSGGARHRDASPASESLGQRVLGGAGGAVSPRMQQPPRGSLCGHTVFFFYYYYLNLFIYLFLAALGLRCCARAFSS